MEDLVPTTSAKPGFKDIIEYTTLPFAVEGLEPEDKDKHCFIHSRIHHCYTQSDCFRQLLHMAWLMQERTKGV
jgi:hypothetical protein